MSPTRIGSTGLFVLTILAMLSRSPTWTSSTVPLGLSVGVPGDWLSKTVIVNCGRKPMLLVRLVRTSPRR